MVARYKPAWWCTRRNMHADTAQACVLNWANVRAAMEGTVVSERDGVATWLPLTFTNSTTTRGPATPATVRYSAACGQRGLAFDGAELHNGGLVNSLRATRGLQIGFDRV